LWERGRPPDEMIQAMSLRPEILRGFAGFGNWVHAWLLERQFCTSLHCDLVDIAEIVADPLVAIENTDPWCRASALRSPTRAPSSPIRTTIPEPLAREVRERFTDAELVELTFLIGYINMLNLFNNALGVRCNGEYGLLRTKQRA